MKEKILAFLQTTDNAADYFKRDNPNKIARVLLGMTRDKLVPHAHGLSQAFALIRFLYHNEHVTIRWAVELAVFTAEKRIWDEFLNFAEKTLDGKFWAAEVRFRALPLPDQFRQWNALVGDTGNRLQCIFDLSLGLNLEGAAEIIRNVIVYYVDRELEPTVPKMQEMLSVLKEQLRPWMPKVK